MLGITPQQTKVLFFPMLNEQMSFLNQICSTSFQKRPLSSLTFITAKASFSITPIQFILNIAAGVTFKNRNLICHTQIPPTILLSLGLWHVRSHTISGPCLLLHPHLSPLVHLYSTLQPRSCKLTDFSPFTHLYSILQSRNHKFCLQY